MEQQSDRVSISQPPSPDTDHSPRQQWKEYIPSTSEFLTPSPPQTPNLERSGSSEPSLRFPRPVGSTHLAHWISSSNPDIMRTTPVPMPYWQDGEVSLEDSTYEYIQTDSEWSQDGAMTDTMSDSDSVDLQRRSMEDHSDNDDSLEPVVVLGYSEINDDSDRRESVGTVGPDSSVQIIKASTYVHQDDEDTAASHSSINYAHESLGTPSLSPQPADTELEDEYDPENLAEIANRIEYSNKMHKMGYTSCPDELKGSATTPGKTARLQWMLGGASDYDDGKDITIRMCITSLFVAVMTFIVVFAGQGYLWMSLLSPPVNSTVATMTYTVTTSTPLLTTPPAPEKTESKALLEFSHANFLPIPCVDDSKKIEPESYEPRFHPTMNNMVQIFAPHEILSRWSNNRCLQITASRNDQVVPLSFQVTDKVTIKFDDSDAYGVVDVLMKATCRPKVQKVIKVHFTRGFIHEVLELTKNFANDVTELVPAAAHEAERRLGDARRCWSNMSATVSNKALTISNNFITDLTTTLKNTHKSSMIARNGISHRMEGALAKIKNAANQVSNELSKGAVRRVNSLQDLQSHLRLNLLNAQVKARAVYLKAFSWSEAQEYERKGKEYLAKMKASVEAASKARHGKKPPKNDKPFWGISWAKYLGLNRDERDVVHMHKDRSQA